MAVFSVAGLSSGIDFQALIKALVDVARQPITLLQKQKTEKEKINSLYQEMNTKLLSLRTAAEAMNLPSEFAVKSATVTDNGTTSAVRLTASATGSATNGTHTLIINQLAQAEKEVHGGTAASTTVVNSSGGNLVFQYTYAGTQRSLTVANGTTLEGLRDLINNDTSNPGVKASILNDGSGSATAYHLVITGNDTGSTKTITINAGTTLNGTGSVDFRSATFTQTQAAQNAQIRVDGYPSTGWIERSGNTITDVLDGVTLNLHRADATVTNTLTISTDTTKVKEKVKALVDAYNTVVQFIREQTKFDTATRVGGPLLGESTTRTVQSQITGIVTGKVLSSGTYTSLSQVGIKTQSDGTLTLDDSAFSTALSANFSAVSDLFADNGTTEGVAEQLRNTLSYLTSIVDGPVYLRRQGLGEAITNLTDQITQKEAELTRYEERLKREFAALEALLSGLSAQGTFLSNQLSRL